MAVRISTAARNAAADAIAALADGGVLRIYTGTQPAGPDTAPSGDLLAEFTLADPAFAAAVAGAADLDTTPAVTATGLDDGTAGWFRICDAGEAGVLDGSVTDTGGGGDLTMNTTTISTGVSVTITAGSITMPAS